MFITEDLKKKDKEDLFKDDSLSALIFYMFQLDRRCGTTHLSKILSLIWSKIRQEMSKSIFGKSTTFWFQSIVFYSPTILSSESKRNKYFVQKLSHHPFSLACNAHVSIAVQRLFYWADAAISLLADLFSATKILSQHLSMSQKIESIFFYTRIVSF